MAWLDGLTAEEAAEALRFHGANTLPRGTPDPWWLRVARQFRSPLIYILLLALVIEIVTWRMGHRPPPWEALAIAVVLLLNAALGVWQEWKTEDALAELERLSAPRAWVVRDGRVQRMASAALVPGDLVRLEAGDRVPADITPLDPENLLADESLLTGESIPVEKDGAQALLAGTLIVRGTSFGRVTRTGRASAMGRLVETLERVRPQPTPLERRLDVFGRRVARWVIGLALIIALAGLWADGPSRLPETLVFAVALAVAAVPEGLPALLTLTLALGVQRMARRKAVVRRLTAVEALGSVTVIASDKTGTLTENRLEVRHLDSPDPIRAARAMVLASSADPAEQIGDPLELALLRHAAEAGHHAPRLRAEFRRVSGRSFESTTRFMRTTVEEDGETVSYFKGAPEVLIERSRLTPGEREVWTRKTDEYAAAGHRLIGLAWRHGEGERDLSWLGLAALWDPPRPEVPEALRQAGNAGIRVLMITGDHGTTALAVARAVGMKDPTLVTGDQLALMNPEDLRRAVRTANVFARVQPEQKLAIVEALRTNGEVVAVTGDGVNDAASLKRADIGIAMGQRGSDVSREVADLVLLDDNFSTIIAAIEEGRGIYSNIQKFIRFLFATNLSEVLLIVLGAALALTIDLRDPTGALLLPLTAAQLLWINLVTDGAPALALILDRSPGLLSGPPRDPRTPLLDSPSLRFILVGGASNALLALALIAALVAAGESSPAVRTGTFLFLALAQLLFVYPARTVGSRPVRNMAVHVAVMAGFALQLLVVALPGTQTVFHAVPVSAAVLAVVGVGCLLAWAVAETLSRRSRRSPAQSPGT